MSVQLILYPQRQNTTNQFLVDGINFAGLNITTSYGTTAIQPQMMLFLLVETLL